MQLRTVLFSSFLLVPALAACGDDSGGGTGGDASTTGATVTSTPAANSSSAAGTGGDPTGGGGDPTGGGGDPTGGGGGDPTALSCDTYCDQIATACDDTNPQYPDSASCHAACETFPDGVYQDDGASLGCHQYHSSAALDDPGVHCGHAGPTGDDQCGTPCQNFCQIAEGVCPDEYESQEVCAKVCEDFELGEFSVDPPATGDTLGCRMYHLTVAAQSEGNAEIHCEHIAAVSSQCN